MNLRPESWLALAAALGILAALCTVPAGLYLDDAIHLATLRGEATPASTFDLFTFASGDAAQTSALMRQGLLPWFTLPELKVRFLRPLSSLTMWLDWQLFGSSAAAFHLHSVLWYAALLWAAGLLYRRVLPGQLAPLALLIFAVDEAHLLPVGWWSNRNALVSVVSALLGLHAHLRWREEGWRPGLWLSLLGFGTGLLGGETALAVLGYVAAYELLNTRHLVIHARGGRAYREQVSGPALQNLLALVPAATLTALYLGLYKFLGYGVFGSGGYHDPISEPAQFFEEGPRNFLALAGNHFFLLQREFVSDRNAAIAGAIAILLVSVALWRLLKQEGEVVRRTLLWLALGACLSAVPSLGTAPASRLNLVPSIGGAVVLAVLVRGLWRWSGRGRRIARAAACAVLAMHVLLSALLWPGLVGAILWAESRVNAAVFTIPRPEQQAPQKMLFLNHPEPIVGVYGRFIYATLTGEEPEHWWNLTIMPRRMRLKRTAPTDLEVCFEERPILRDGTESLFRSMKYPLRAGEVVDLGEVQVEVLELQDEYPKKILLIFEVQPEWDRLLVLTWDNDGYAPVELPAVGEEVLLERGKGLF